MYEEIPANSPLQAILELPRLRDPKHRLGRDLTMNSSRQRVALLIQSRGVEVERHQWCGKCARGGTFDRCVYLPGSETKACASCKYGGDRCDFVSVPLPGQIDAEKGETPESKTPRLHPLRQPVSTSSKRRRSTPASNDPAPKRTRIQPNFDTPVPPRSTYASYAAPTNGAYALQSDSNDIRSVIRQELALHRAQESQIRTLIQNEIAAHLPALLESMSASLTASVSSALSARFQADPDLLTMDNGHAHLQQNNSIIMGSPQNHQPISRRPPNHNSSTAPGPSRLRSVTLANLDGAADSDSDRYSHLPNGDLSSGPIEANPAAVAAAVAASLPHNGDLRSPTEPTLVPDNVSVIMVKSDLPNGAHSRGNRNNRASHTPTAGGLESTAAEQMEDSDLDSEDEDEDEDELSSVDENVANAEQFE